MKKKRPQKSQNKFLCWNRKRKMEDDFIAIEDQEPHKGQYCEMRVVSIFKGWYLPECQSWTWLMDEDIEPVSTVESWRPDKEKNGVFYDFN